MRDQNWPGTTQVILKVSKLLNETLRFVHLRYIYSDQQKCIEWRSLTFSPVCLALDNIVRARECKLSNFPTPWVASNDLLYAYLKCQATSWLNLSTMVSWNIEFIVTKCHLMIYHLKIQHDLVFYHRLKITQNVSSKINKLRLKCKSLSKDFLCSCKKTHILMKLILKTLFLILIKSGWRIFIFYFI